MADSVWTPALVAVAASEPAPARHSAIVRITHWLTAICFIALLVSGVEILISHPRFYWGETGNVMMPALFKIPIPASRSSFPTGYGYVLPDQNGWSRYLHFQAAWIAVLTGLFYVINGLVNGHFLRDLIPDRTHLAWPHFSKVIAGHLRLKPAADSSYNVLQRLTYMVVIFVLFPLVIWTGLAMSPAIASVFPIAVKVLGGQQSARTIHFFVSLSLVLFLLIHVGMICLAGFRTRMKAMITGAPATSPATSKEQES